MDTRIETKCVQEGWKPKDGEPRLLPIYQSTTFKYDDPERMADLFLQKGEGHLYSRISNPTVECVENKIAALEGGVGAMLCSSGQSATMAAVTNIARAGDHVVCSSAIYGGSYNLFNKTLRDFGIDFTFIDPRADETALNAAFKDNTKLVFAETVSNPSLVILDTEKFSKAAHSHGVPLVVDNTFATPVNFQPFKWGADIITHSASKYMDGHACVVSGAVVDSGKFDWSGGKYPGLTEPDESYGGRIYTEAFGDAAYIAKLRCHLMRDAGYMLSPHSAFLLNHGLETMALRVERHCENALAIAKYLENHPMITWVNCPMLESSPDYALAKKYMPKGVCGVVSFGIKGGRAAAANFMKKVRLAAVVTHVADLRTSLLHPASTTHRQMTDEQMAQSGIPADMIRFSVGIENKDDIIADIEQALREIQ